MKRLLSIITIMVGIVSSMVFVSCTDDSENNAPVIHGVRMIEPEYADSLFNEAVPGQSIVIVGENLATTSEIYINDQKVQFQGTYVTDTHIILTIPSEIELTGMNPSLKNEIRLHTKGGVATYPFHINAGSCQIASMKANYPIAPGDEITLIGTNFIDIESVMYIDNLPDDGKEEDKEWWEIADDLNSRAATQEIQGVDITDYWVNATATELHVKLPDNLVDCGWLLVKTHTNTQTAMIFKNATKATITGINSDMPVLGSTVRIYGSGFVGVMSIIIGDNEVVVPKKDFKISDDADVIEFTMPALPTKGKTLTLSNPAGDVTIPFYDTSMVMFDLDGKGKLNWGGATKITGDGKNPPYVTSGQCAGLSHDVQGPTYWWGDGRMAFKDMSIPVSEIPEDTPIGKVELRYEGYFMTDFKYTKVEFKFGENGQWIREQPHSLFNNGILLNEWATYYVPLSLLAGSAKTWGEYVKTMTLPEFVIHAIENTTKNSEHIQFYVDNLRLYVNTDNN